MLCMQRMWVVWEYIWSLIMDQFFNWTTRRHTRTKNKQNTIRYTFQVGKNVEERHISDFRGRFWLSLKLTASQLKNSTFSNYSKHLPWYSCLLCVWMFFSRDKKQDHLLIRSYFKTEYIEWQYNGFATKVRVFRMSSSWVLASKKKNIEFGHFEKERERRS